jgi:hypothetical protein
MHPFNVTEKLFFPFVIVFAVFVSVFLITLIPCSFISFIKNKGSLKKTPLYAFYSSVGIILAVFIISLPLYINMNFCKIDEIIGTLCILSVGVVPFVSIVLATWASIMLLMLLRNRILNRRGY